jgi:hypothetical protein
MISEEWHNHLVDHGVLDTQDQQQTQEQQHEEEEEEEVEYVTVPSGTLFCPVSFNRKLTSLTLFDMSKFI